MQLHIIFFISFLFNGYSLQISDVKNKRGLDRAFNLSVLRRNHINLRHDDRCLKPKHREMMLFSRNSDETILAEIDTDIPHSSSKNGQILSLLIGSAYLSIIASVMTLPSVLSLVDNDAALNFQNSRISLATTVSLATVAIMIGKIVLGPITDKIGGSKVNKCIR